MANRYWRAGAGTWSGVNTTSWSATSGGIGGASVPTLNDDVFFTNLASATSYTCTLSGTLACKSLSISGPAAGAVTIAGTSALAISGGLSIASTGVVITYTGAISFKAVGGSWPISAGVTLSSAITFNGAGGAWYLASAFYINNTVTVTAGAFDTAGFTLNIPSFVTAGTLVRSIALGASLVILTGSGSIINFSGSNFTLSSGTSTIVTPSLTGITFNGGGFTYNDLVLGGASGTNTTFSGSNTFNTISRNNTSQQTITFTSGTTTTVANWTVTGTPGNLVSIRSTLGTRHNLIKTGGGNISVDYLNIWDSNAT